MRLHLIERRHAKLRNQNKEWWSLILFCHLFFPFPLSASWIRIRVVFFTYSDLGSLKGRINVPGSSFQAALYNVALDQEPGGSLRSQTSPGRRRTQPQSQRNNRTKGKWMNVSLFLTPNPNFLPFFLPFILFYLSFPCMPPPGRREPTETLQVPTSTGRAFPESGQ